MSIGDKPILTRATSPGLDVERELLRAAFARMPLNMAMTTFAAVLFVMLWWHTFPSDLLMVWCAGILFFGVIVRYPMWLIYQRSNFVNDAISRWEKYYFYQTALSGFAWGLGPALILSRSVETESALLVAILFAVCSVAINTLAAQRRAMQAFILLAMLPPSVAAWTATGQWNLLVAYTLLACGLVLLTIARGTSEATRKIVATELRLRNILETAMDAVIEADAKGIITDWNLRAESMFGWTRQEALGCSISSLIIPSQHRKGHEHSMARFLKMQVPSLMNQRIETSALRRDGVEFPIEIGVTTIKTGDDRQFIAFATDITDRQRNAVALKDSEIRFRNLTELSPEAIVVHRAGVIKYVNPTAIRLFGATTAEDLVETPVLDRIHPDFRAAVIQRVKTHANNESVAPPLNEVFLKLDGTPIQVEVQGRTMLFDGQPAIYASMRDITEATKADEALRIAATAFESQQGMIITNADKVILKVNHAFTDITGYSAQEAIGQTPRLLSSGRHDTFFYAAMWADITRTGKWQGEIWNRHKDGEIFPEWLTVTAVKNNQATVTHYVAAFSDISQRKEAESQIRNLAFYDPLTELPNRRLLMDRLDQALSAGARHKQFGAILFIDLDNFKNINDTLGHQKGDILLTQVGQRLCTCVRQADTVSRLGGDEFVVMLEELGDNAPDAAAQAEVVGVKILTAVGQPYLIDGRDCRTSPSIGVALFSGHLETVDELLKRADMAMYQAKAAGRNTLRFFDPQMQAVVEANAVLEADLREALAQQQFCLHYQAQVTPEGSIVGVEALVRWQHPHKGMVPPAAFIPMAEQTGLILPLGAWVLLTACKQISRWSRHAALSKLTIAVNVSALQFRQTNFVDQVLTTLMQTGANPHCLKLELTESLLVDDVDDVIAKMSALKTMGVGFSLDDFGTGYSSLAYLSRLPLDQLKIDRGFVKDIETSANAVAICAATISLAHSLRMKVVAEGVETRAQQYFLGTTHQCDLMQGYLFSRPLPLPEFEALARSGAAQMPTPP